MAIGGIAELLFGVRAEQKQLEDIAEPLTAEGEDEGKGAEEARPAERPPAPPAPRPRATRFRLGPGPLYSARGMGVSGPHAKVAVDREAQIIARALDEHGSANRRELRRRVGARYWGPGRFAEALSQAVQKGEVKRLPRGQFGPSHQGEG